MRARETGGIRKDPFSKGAPQKAAPGTDAFGAIERKDGGKTSGTTEVTRTVRRMRRIGGSRRPFFPYGFVPLTGLTLLFPLGWIPFAFAAIEREVSDTARGALASVGANWATASIDGQWVHLGGIPPSKEAADKAVEAVRSARADTLFGAAYPVTRITTRFIWADAAAAPPPAQAETPAAPAPTPPAEASPVPTPAAPVTVTPAPPPIACDQTLASLLGQARIEFETNSSAISGESAGLLDEVAKAVASCPPGRLRIEGHTDNVGSAALNTSLSQRRAEAVRHALVARGLAQDRLVAVGFGSTKPVADNAAEDGRARNRRIEIRMIPPT